MGFVEVIKENNEGHKVDGQELQKLVDTAKQVYHKEFSNETWFERSIFTNWTCAIADCQYCYLSTKPKYSPRKGTRAVRSRESILAEALVCKILGWRVGYLTGGLRVERTEELCSLMADVEKVLGEKPMINFGPYNLPIIKKFKPFLSGMGSAIESFDEDLHNFICPSKPLKSLMAFLGNLRDEGLEKMITIILGIGERKEDVEIVIEKIKEYEVNVVQLCFLKPQEHTIFASVPSPNPPYMAWWIARLRIACPRLKIKVALVKDRIADLSLYLDAGANAFTRFMVFSDFAGSHALELEEQCEKAGRKLLGNFSSLPGVDVEQEVMKLNLPLELRKKIVPKAQQYWKKLEKRV